MSEALSQTETPVEAGSPPPAPFAVPLDEGGVNWGDSEPPAAEVAPAAEPTPEVAAPAAVPEADPDFSISTLQSGEKEIRLTTGQVYRGKDDSAVISQLAKAQAEASRTIRGLKEPKPEPTPEVIPPQTNQVDPSSIALLDLLAPALGLKNGKEVAEAFTSLQQKTAEFQPLTEEMRNNRTAIQFIQSTPEFVASPANSDRIGEWLDERRIPFTVQNAQDAFYALKGRGLLEVGQPQLVGEAPRLPNGQFAPKVNNMPPPPAAAAPAPRQQQKDPFQMTDEEFDQAYAGFKRVG